MAICRGKAAEVAQKAEGAALGRSVPGAQARSGEAAVAVVEELAAKPRADGTRNRLAAKEMGEFAQDEVGVDARLGFEVAGIGFAFDFAFAFVKEECCLDAVGDFLNEGDEGGDVAFVEGAARVVGLKFGDDGARVKNGEVKGIARLPKESSSAGGEMGGIFTRQPVERGAAALADDAGFQVDRNGSVGALEQRLDFPQEGHNRIMKGE